MSSIWPPPLSFMVICLLTVAATAQEKPLLEKLARAEAEVLKKLRSMEADYKVERKFDESYAIRAGIPKSNWVETVSVTYRQDGGRYLYDMTTKSQGDAVFKYKVAFDGIRYQEADYRSGELCVKKGDAKIESEFLDGSKGFMELLSYVNEVRDTKDSFETFLKYQEVVDGRNLAGVLKEKNPEIKMDKAQITLSFSGNGLWKQDEYTVLVTFSPSKSPFPVGFERRFKSTGITFYRLKVDQWGKTKVAGQEVLLPSVMTAEIFDEDGKRICTERTEMTYKIGGAASPDSEYTLDYSGLSRIYDFDEGKYINLQ